MSNEEIRLRNKLFGLESRLAGELNPIITEIKAIERELAELNEKAAKEELSHYDAQTVILLKAKLASWNEYKGAIENRYMPYIKEIKDKLAAFSQESKTL